MTLRHHERLSPAVQAALGPDARIDRVEPLAADASTRVYVRVFTTPAPPPGPDGRTSFAAMLLDPSAFLKSDEGTSGHGPARMPFLVVNEYLSGLGLPVPHVHAVDETRGVVLLDDLGDITHYAYVRPFVAAGDRAALLDAYREVIDLLVRTQSRTFVVPEPTGFVAGRRFDAELLEWELWHFVRWIVEHEHAAELTPGERTVVARDFSALARALAALPARPVHRDWQSRNLMRTRTGTYIIDHQDMLLGPPLYDLVSLLRDSYVVLAADEVDELVAYYRRRADAAGLLTGDLAALDVPRVFALQTLQRKLKDAGRFINLRERRKTSGYLGSVAPSLGYVRDAFSRLPEYHDTAAILGRYEPRVLPAGRV